MASDSSNKNESPAQQLRAVQVKSTEIVTRVAAEPLVKVDAQPDRSTSINSIISGGSVDNSVDNSNSGSVSDSSNSGSSHSSDRRRSRDSSSGGSSDVVLGLAQDIDPKNFVVFCASLRRYVAY
jgi:hypothetical protein